MLSVKDLADLTDTDGSVRACTHGREEKTPVAGEGHFSEGRSQGNGIKGFELEDESFYLATL